MRSFNRLVTAAFISILFITLVAIFGYFLSFFSYGAQVATGVEAVSSENFGSNLYQNCVNQYGANNPACQLVYNQTMQSINNYNNASFWYNITGNPYIWITFVGIVGVIAYMLYVQNKG